MKTILNMTNDIINMVNIIGEKDGIFEYTIDPIPISEPHTYHGLIVESEYEVDDALIVVYDQKIYLPPPRENILLLVTEPVYTLLSGIRSDLCTVTNPIFDASTKEFLGYSYLVHAPGAI